MKLFCLPILLVLLLAGCARKQSVIDVPSPPEIAQEPLHTANPSPTQEMPNTPAAQAPVAAIRNAKPLYAELGLASWYGAPYHNRRGSNGEIYDMNQMTAAHRTLPLNSIARVTNIKTGSSAVVRITDRGPFIGERILDLSVAAAKAVDVWNAGTAWGKLEVLEAPVPLDTGGKWAVQIGAFETLEAVVQMKQNLIDGYHPARVLEFAGPTGQWIRIRVQDDDRGLAERISRSITTPEGGVFLVRLD